jgi:hypothetical protein
MAATAAYRNLVGIGFTRQALGKNNPTNGSGLCPNFVPGTGTPHLN